MVIGKKREEWHGKKLGKKTNKQTVNSGIVGHKMMYEPISYILQLVNCKEKHGAYRNEIEKCCLHYLYRWELIGSLL